MYPAGDGTRSFSPPKQIPGYAPGLHWTLCSFTLLKHRNSTYRREHRFTDSMSPGDVLFRWHDGNVAMRQCVIIDSQLTSQPGRRRHTWLRTLEADL